MAELYSFSMLIAGEQEKVIKLINSIGTSEKSKYKILESEKEREGTVDGRFFQVIGGYNYGDPWGIGIFYGQEEYRLLEDSKKENLEIEIFFSGDSCVGHCHFKNGTIITDEERALIYIDSFDELFEEGISLSEEQMEELSREGSIEIGHYDNEFVLLEKKEGGTYEE